LVTADAVSFAYDHSGYRIKKVVNPTTTKNYHLEGEHLEAVYDDQAVLQAKYFRGGVIDEIVNAYQRNAAGDLINSTFHHDALQSVLGQSLHDGNILAAQSYTAYGRILNQVTPSNNDQKYTGRERDGVTGFYYYRARYYDPVIGRFISEDPKGFDAGVNFYAYCLDNPINCNDPTGKAGMVVTFPGYNVDTGLGFRIPLVHGGVVAIDNSTGNTQYFEFGRYGGQYGDVRGPIDVGNVTFNSNGSITRDSMQTLNQNLSKFGQGMTPTTLYNSEYDATEISNFALDRQANVKDYPYTINPNPFDDKPFNTCVNFAWDAFQAGKPSQSASNSNYGIDLESAQGGFLIYPNKPNHNMMASVYAK
jgi:RHS repeat-associated protein